MRTLGKIALNNVIKNEEDGMVSLVGWDPLGRAWMMTTNYGDGTADAGWSRQDNLDMIAVCECRAQGCVCDEDYRAARDYQAARHS